MDGSSPGGHEGGGEREEGQSPSLPIPTPAETSGDYISVARVNGMSMRMFEEFLYHYFLFVCIFEKYSAILCSFTLCISL